MADMTFSMATLISYYNKAKEEAKDKESLARVKSYEKNSLKRIEEAYEKEALNYCEFRIEWIKNKTWGMCPRGEYRSSNTKESYYKDYIRSITGCGFDKLSQFTANALNDDLTATRLLLDWYDSNKKLDMTYGVRNSNGVPYFEGAVGIECHKRAFELMGFKVSHFDTKKSDIIIVER